MSILTQGTNIYFIDPTATTPAVTKVTGATSFNPGGTPAAQIEDTPLDAFSRTYMPGLRTPATATMGLNMDSSNASHVELYNLASQNPPPELVWAIGWADGTDDPTLNTDGDGFDLPATRTWLTFSGYVSDIPPDFQTNSVVQAQVSIARSGDSVWTPKSA